MITQRGWMTLLLPLIAAACSQTSIPEDGSKVGSLSLSLTGVDPHGISYRLSSAEFEVSGCPDYFQSSVAGFGAGSGGGGQGGSNCIDMVLRSDDNPDSAVITQRLLPGYYNVQLLDGWTIEQLTAAGPTPVAKAVLLSPSYQYAYVWDGGVSQVVYSFGVGGDLIDFRHGDLAISISVEQPGDHDCSTGVAGGGFAGGVSCVPTPGGSGGFGGPAGIGGSFGAAGVGF
jgi:hypothetical protein